MTTLAQWPEVLSEALQGTELRGLEGPQHGPKSIQKFRVKG